MRTVHNLAAGKQMECNTPLHKLRQLRANVNMRTSRAPSLAMVKVRVAHSPSVTPAPKSTADGDTDSAARLVRQRMGTSKGPLCRGERACCVCVRARNKASMGNGGIHALDTGALNPAGV